jgi:hypothetical protein
MGGGRDAAEVVGFSRADLQCLAELLLKKSVAQTIEGDAAQSVAGRVV